MKKISVIICVYNCEKYLEDCLNSVQNQTMPKNDYDVIIINDGSTDNSISIINKYSKKNKEWIIIDRKINKGIATSRNEGLQKANSKYITFLDSDDIFEENALEEMYNQTQKNNCQIGIFRTTRFKNNKIYSDSYLKILEKIKTITNINESKDLARVVRNAAILYDLKLVKKIKLIPNVVHEDNYFCIKAYSAANLIYVSNKSVYKIRIRNEKKSITQTQSFKSYKDLYINLVQADLEVKNSKIVKIHLNQLFSYICKSVSKNNWYEAILMLKDYLYEMKKNNIISTVYYLYLKLYLESKCLIKLYKYIFVKAVKLFYLSILTIISPVLNTKVFYKKRIGEKINLKNPETFNEKIQWLKLNYLYPNDLVTRCADKVAVRDYIKELGCEEILIDTIKIYNNVDEINFDELPNKFVLKWNFGCGYNIICTDKSKLNVNVTKKILKKWGRSKFHLHNSELHYKKINRKIICEKFIEPENGVLPEDYKFYCFNGKAEYVMICYGRDKGKPDFYFFDRNWKIAKINKKSEKLPNNFNIPKPKMMDEMFKYADKLSKEFPFVRVDLYTTQDKVYFGELTFTPSAGLDTGYTEKGSKLLASKIKITDVKK